MRLPTRRRARTSLRRFETLAKRELMAADGSDFLPACEAVPTAISTMIVPLEMATATAGPSAAPIRSFVSTIGSDSVGEGESMPMPPSISLVVDVPIAAGESIQRAIESIVVEPPGAGEVTLDIDPQTTMPIGGLVVTAEFTPFDPAQFAAARVQFGLSAGGRLDVSGPGKDIFVGLIGDDLTVARSTNEIVIVSPSTVDDLRILGLPTATVVTVGVLSGGDDAAGDDAAGDDSTGNDSAAGGFGVTFIGGPSVDTVRASGSVDGLTLKQNGSLRVENIEAIDLSESRLGVLRIDSASLAIADADGDGVVVSGDVELDLVDPASFSLGNPVSLAGQTLANLSSGATFLSISVQSAYHNPIADLDVDNNGTIEPLDALLVINELRAQRFHDPETGEIDSIDQGRFAGF